MSGNPLRRSSSSSLSNIPLFKTRTSRSTAAPEVKLKRSKSSLSIITPMNSARLGRPKTSTHTHTPLYSTSGSKKHLQAPTVSASKSANRNKSPIRQRRPLDNKKWVENEFKKVYDFLSDHQKFDPQVLKHLKPPTINTFVYVCDLLLKDIDHRIEISSNNYQKVLSDYLKLLGYPEAVTVSFLKTVNTPRCIPGVVSIWSWLVDLILTLEAAKEQGDEFYNIMINHFAESWYSWNYEGDNSEENERFESRLIKAYNIDLEKIEQLKNDLEKCKENRDKLKIELEERANRNEISHQENERKRKELEDVYRKREEDGENRKVQKEELLKQKKESLKRRDEEAGRNQNLKEILKNQPCPFTEKQKLLSHIESLKHTIFLKKEKLEMRKKMKDEFDFKIVEAKRKLETEVYRINIAVIELSSLQSDLQSLQLREDGFLKDFDVEIRRMLAEKERKENEISTEIKKLQENISEYQKTVAKLNAETKSINKENKTLLKKKKEFENRISIHIGDTEKLKEDIEQREKEGQKQIADFLKNLPDFKALKGRNGKLELKIKALQIESKELQEQSLKFMIKLREQKLNALTKYEVLRQEFVEILKQLQESAVKAQDDTIKQLDELNGNN